MKKSLWIPLLVIVLFCLGAVLIFEKPRWSPSVWWEIWTGTIYTGSAITSWSEVLDPQNFFAVGGMDLTNPNKIEIYKKNDVNSPYQVVMLPTPTGTWRYFENFMNYHSPIFFENTWIYILWGYTDDNGFNINEAKNEAIIFYVSLDGKISINASMKNLSPNNLASVDQKNGKIVWLGADNCSIMTYDIASATYKNFTKNILTNSGKKLCNQDQWLSLILSIKDSVINVLFDVQGIDSFSPKARVRTIDEQSGQVLSDIPYAQYTQQHPNRIIYTGECLWDSTNCYPVIDGKQFWNNNKIYFRSFVNDTTMFATTSTGYVFVSLDSLISK